MHTFETPEPIAAVVDMTAGEVRIDASDRADTVVEVRPSDPAKRADVTAAEQMRVEYAAGRLVVKTTQRWRSFSPFSHGGSVDVRLELPTGSSVSGRAAMAAFRCSGSLAGCEVKTSLGDIEVERAATVELTTSVGDISVDHVGGNAKVSTSTGTLRVGRVDGTAVLKNSNGEARATDVRGDLRVATANGDITVESTAGSIVAKSGRGDIRVSAAARGPVVAETGFGEVEIGIPDGVAAWLDLVTGFGQLQNMLEETAAPGQDDVSIEVRVRTGYGDITIRRAAPPASVASDTEGRHT
jgi:DUF4097 and DUF4098 domain-containing protein YvlB